jgi:general secretion pathway protein K
MVQIEELYRVRGFDAPTVAKLKPYVTALPERTLVNVNTAPDKVLAALLPTVPAPKITEWVNTRRTKPMKAASDIALWATGDAAAPGRAAMDVKSAYFSVRTLVAQDDVELSTDALLKRSQNAAPIIQWRRPRY